ncbi:MAG: carboxypeptidase-like regulatory domain-containing protein [Pseudomonadota bacterium]
MSTKLSVTSLILICILLILSTSAWGRSIITGQVVDAETGKPIKGAAVHIYWGKPGSGPPGLAASSVEVEVAEVLTDTEGFFKIPKYSTLFKHYDMAVYKKGYVCWSSEKIFPTWEDRKNFKLKNGMVIKPERFKEGYSREDHGRFTVFMSTSRNAPGLFDNAIKLERLLFRKMMRSK